MSSKREEIENNPRNSEMSKSDWKKLLDKYFQERLKECRIVLNVAGSGYHAK